MEQLNELPVTQARAVLTACCGAPAWVQGMLATRPWRNPEGVLAAADRIWENLTTEQRLEAIEHHPRLGASVADVPLDERARRWSAREQRGAAAADTDTRTALAHGNAAYEHRFGHTFILCAKGLSAKDMLRSLTERLTHDPETERTNTTRELHRITRLRLEELLTGDAAREEAP